MHNPGYRTLTRTAPSRPLSGVLVKAGGQVELVDWRVKVVIKRFIPALLLGGAVLLVFLLLIFWWGTSPAWLKGKPPNILVIVLDAARADHLGCYGYPLPTTPRIDRISEKSLIFTHAFAVAPHTLASTASLFTSLYPESHNVLTLQSRLGEKVPTLAETFKRAGYRTVLVANNPSFHPTFGLLRGFDVALWEDSVDLNRSSRVTEKVLLNLEEADPPFFFYVHYLRPHLPYDALEEVRSILGRKGTPILSDTKAANEGRVAMTKELLEGMKADYDASLRMVDTEVGKVILHLEERGLLSQTVLVIMSDHGEAFGEHGMVDHVWTVYDEMIHIPLILHYPGVLAAEKNRNLADTVDLFPTLCELAGLAPPALIHGQSLLNTPREYVFSRSLSQVPAFAVRSLRRKLIRSADGKQQEFYDLERDPLEKDPVESGQGRTGYDKERKQMERVFTRWLGSCLENRYEADIVPSLDPDLISRLKSLGYLR